MGGVTDYKRRTQTCLKGITRGQKPWRLRGIFLFLQLLIHITENAEEWDVFHPSLIDIGLHGATQALELFISMVNCDKLGQRLALNVLLCFNLYRYNSLRSLYQIYHQ